MAALDFPASPTNGQVFTGVGGINWVWDGAKWNPGTSLSAGQFVPLAGGTMTGPLVLSGPPTIPLHAASKAYVDGFLSLVGGTLTGDLTIAPATSHAQIFLNKSSTGGANSNIIWGRRSGLNRWNIDLGNADAESSGNAGSNFAISRWNDAGTLIDSPLVINRADGVVRMIGATVSGPNAVFELNKPASGAVSVIAGKTANNNRWLLYLGEGSAETGGNTGSNFAITRYNDAGVGIDAPLTINRATGVLNYSAGGIFVYGTGQVGGWSTTGAKGSAISLVDSSFSAGSGGTVEFGAGAGAWLFAAIKGNATNGGGNSQGEINFLVRVLAADTALTKKGVLAADGVWYNTNASWSAISDRAMKENIVPYNNGLTAIRGLEPIEFDYIEDSPFGSGETRHIGLIAQDAEAFIPECIGSMEVDQMTDDPKSIATLNTGPLLYTLINAVKELASRLEALETAGSA